MEKLMSLEEVQKYLPVQMTTLRLWVFKKHLPTVRLGRRVFVKESVVEKIINEGLESYRGD